MFTPLSSKTYIRSRTGQFLLFTTPLLREPAGGREGQREKEREGETERGREKAEERRKFLQCSLPLQVFESMFSKGRGSLQVRINQTTQGSLNNLKLRGEAQNRSC